MGIVQKTYNYILLKFFWSSMMKDIRKSHKEMCYNEGFDDCVLITNKHIGDDLK